MDAAVATAFALAVTRPHYAALGGGGFIVFCPHSTAPKPIQCQSIDYREVAPAAATRNLFIRNGKAMTILSQNGALASGVPGTPAGLLLALEKFGTQSRHKILSRPIALARKGYTFTSHSEVAALERWQHMNDEAKKLFGCLNSSKQRIPCPPGTRIRQPDLARVLAELDQKGPQGFYSGWVAKKIIGGIQKAGGILTFEDLKSYRPKIRTVIKSQFENYELVSMPPPSSGGAILAQLLGYAHRADQSQKAFERGYESVDSLQALIHGMALSFADRAQYFGDPDYVKIPLAQLLSPTYLDDRWKTFQTEEADLPTSGGELGSEPQHTTHLSVIDRYGNTAALTTTVNDNFGSGFVPPGTGVVMNDQMDDFSVQPGAPNMFGLVGNEANSIAPRKRPLSSMTPTILRDSKTGSQIVIGAAGGPRIITSVFLSILNRVKFKMSLTDAVAAPRIHQQWKPVTTRIERHGFSPETLDLLKKKGYQFEEVTTLGKVHALERLPNGRTLGVPDPRGEGSAVAE
jgi:gamma-glutamyltranspeptidase/glutathione hydrolase